ncbi:uncharacterized protein LOC144285105 [Canis aureus]
MIVQKFQKHLAVPVQWHMPTNSFYSNPIMLSRQLEMHVNLWNGDAKRQLYCIISCSREDHHLYSQLLIIVKVLLRVPSRHFCSRDALGKSQMPQTTPTLIFGPAIAAYISNSFLDLLHNLPSLLLLTCHYRPKPPPGESGELQQDPSHPADCAEEDEEYFWNLNDVVWTLHLCVQSLCK